MAQKKKDSGKLEYKDLRALISRATECFDKNDFEKTISLCAKAKISSEDKTDAAALSKLFFMWVLALMKLNRYDYIGIVIEKAHKYIGAYLDLDFMKVMAAYGSQDYAKTIEYVEKYMQQHTKTDPHIDSHLCQSFNSLQEIYRLGVEAARNIKDVDKALEFMAKSLELKEDNHAQRVEMASLLAKVNKDEKSLRVLDEGIAKFPQTRALKNAKGYLLGELHRYPEAEDYINGILTAYPDDTDALNNLGVIYDCQGKYDNARMMFSKVLEIEPNNITAKDNLKYLSNIVSEKPETISACMIVKNEEKFLPGCLASIKNLVDEIIIVDTGSTDRTMEIAREYSAKIYEHPWQNDFSFHRNQSIGYGTCDWILIIDADEELVPAEHETIKMAIKRQDVDAISFVVYNKIQLGRVGFLNSHRMFRNHKGFKYHGIVHNQLEITGKTLMSQFKVIHHGYGLSEEQMEKKGRRSEALLLKQLEDNPDLIFPHFNLAQIYRGLGEPDKSLEHAAIVIDKIGPDDMDRRHVFLMAMDQKGCAHIGLEQLDEAEKVFKKALEYKDDYLDPMFNLGFMYMRQRRYAEAEEIFDRYLKARARYRPENEWMGLILNNLNSEFAVYYSIGFIHYLKNDVNKALEFFNKSLAQSEDFEYIHHLLARCYRDTSNFHKIIEHCDKSIKFGHEDVEIRLLEGESYLNLGEPDKARESFNRALELDPDHQDARLGLVGAASLDKNPQELLQILDEFLEKSPSSPQGLASKGDVLFNIGDYARAKDNYEKSIRENPDDFKILNNLGNCFLKEKNFASAETYYLMALRKNRNFLPGYRNLAVALINQNKLKDAADYLEYYLQIYPQDNEVNLTLGDIYYNQKDYYKSIIHFEKYLAVHPGNMDVLIRIADCYFNLGKLQAAAAGYGAVLAKDSANEIARNRLRDLDNFLKPVNN